MRRRAINAFSLSFLDCICCGFGAIILVFIVIIHRVSETTASVTEDLRADALRQELRVNVLSSAVDDATATLRELDTELASLEAQLARLSTSVKAATAEQKPKPPPTPRAEKTPPQRTLTMGRPHEAQLLGLRMDDRRSLVLVDASASMLDKTIVGIVRRRHRSAAEKRAAPKWRQALSTAEWIVEHLPIGGQFQIYTFGVTSRPVLEDTAGRWLDAVDSATVKRALGALRDVVPEGGTSLHAAVRAMATMSPRPDAVYVLTDGLPTQGGSPSSRNTVTGKQRVEHFRSALRELPRGIIMNVILYPLEGDPGAATAYWDLTVATGGSFVSPAEDWP
jgi:hypothetical protein